MDNRTRSLNLGNFMQNLKQHFVVDALKKLKETQVMGYARSGDYICPSVFYNHGSRTFLKNKRKGL